MGPRNSRISYAGMPDAYQLLIISHQLAECIFALKTECKELSLPILVVDHNRIRSITFPPLPPESDLQINGIRPDTFQCKLAYKRGPRIGIKWSPAPHFCNKI